MIDSIFVDMDGVTVDFYRGALELYGFDPDMDLSGKSYDELWSLGWIAGGSEDAFWEKVDSLGTMFWENLRPLPWAMKLWNACNEITDRTYILSKPSRHSMGSSTGKHRWISKHLQNDRKYIFTPHKHFCAAKNRVLIDDRPQNIKKWVKNKGIGILFKEFREEALDVDETIWILNFIKNMEFKDGMKINRRFYEKARRHFK